ncbi:MAG TPA: hypothetical protein VIX89_15275 [Bryobacteraceae bacterium]
MKWICLGALSLAATWSGFADKPAGSLDPIFKTVPFDSWSEKDSSARFRWSTHISSPVLSQHQRLLIDFKIQVDGAELVKRRGQGRVQLLIQLRDQAGALYQNHNSMTLEDVKPELSRSYSIYTQNALVAPGDYEVSLGWFVTATGEHAVVRRPLHVDPLAHDPLPDAWRDLPSVAFLPEELTASWYGSAAGGRLNLPVETPRPVRIELLVNASRTEQMAQPSSGGSRLSASILIPVINVLSQIKPGNGSLNLAMLDLERQRVGFEQKAVRELDWTKLLDTLSADNPNTIDLKSLERRQQNAQFFVSEIRHRVQAGVGVEGLHVLIVLSGMMAFDRADLTPMRDAPDPNCKVFYIRYRSITHLPSRVANPFFPAGAARRPIGRRGPVSQDPALQPRDDLFVLIKSLDPRLFDVATPAEFRKALANIMSEIARLV